MSEEKFSPVVHERAESQEAAFDFPLAVGQLAS